MTDAPSDRPCGELPEVHAGRLRVLIQAYACSPERGSEEGIGWGWAIAIAEFHDVWVITASHFRDEIERWLAKNPSMRSRIRFEYVERRRWLWLEQLWPPAYLWSYQYQWQRAAYDRALALDKTVGFDLVHQLTYEGFRAPGHLWRMPQPFVWGPIGGLEQTTWSLLPPLGLRAVLHFSARNVINSLHKRFLRAPKLAMARARGGIISATGAIQREIRECYHEDGTVISEIGLPPRQAATVRVRDETEPLRISWSGLHIDRKALPFLLEALQELPPDLEWRLDILGSGPRTRRWKRIAERLGVAERCTWRGMLPRTDALEIVGRSHVFAVTSVYDLTSTVVIEALALGVPLVVPDHCGFRDAVTEDCGFRVPATSPSVLVHGIAAALSTLGRDESLRQRLAGGALERAALYDWPSKARAVDAIYRRKMKESGDRAGISQGPTSGRAVSE